MDDTVEAESPRSYFWWSGLCAISAVVSNKVYVNKQIYKLYPNLFVLLIGKSGLRKSGPVSMVKQIVERSELVKVISGRSSIQAIVKQLGQAWTLESGKVLADPSAFIVSSEFASSLVKDEAALTILTDLHDSHYHSEGWRYTLKNSAPDFLKSPCITFLSATNQTHFDDMISETSMMGGFIARTILVVENKKSRINALLDESEKKFNSDKFIPYLKELSKIEGEMILNNEAKDMYKSWYHSFCESDIDDKTGTSERVHDRIMKVAMNISLAENTSLLITGQHMQMALDACINGVSLANKATMSSGKSELAAKAAIFMNRLFTSPDYTIDRKTLLSREWGNFDHQDLDRIVQTLEAGGMITSEAVGGVVYYQLTEGSIQYYLSETKKN